MVAPLYRGYSTVSNSGVNTRLHNIALVKQDLLNHFNTRLGERVGRPEFGSIIHDLHFDLFDTRTEQLIYQDALRIVRSDPRVTPMKIDILLDDSNHTIRINILLHYVEFNMEEWFSYTFNPS